jgi:hypothetical protein
MIGATNSTQSIIAVILEPVHFIDRCSMLEQNIDASTLSCV